MTKNAAIYLRVSTEAQVDRFGLDAQRNQCEAMVTVKGWSLVATFSDEGLSGTLSPAKRPGMASLLASAERGEVEAVVVAALDRLGRDTRVVLGIVEQLSDLGVKLVSCRESLDTSTPTGQFVLTMFAALAQLDKDNTVRRLWDGRRSKLRSGQVVDSGMRPYGYESKEVGGRVEFVVNEDKADVVRLIYQLYTREGMSTYDIAEHLTKLRIPRPSDGDGYDAQVAQRQREYGHWSHSTVGGILRNELYHTGVWVYGKGSKWDLEPIEVPIPPIIDEATFEAARQARGAASSKPSNVKHEYLLAGRMTCGKCDTAGRGSYVINKSGTKYLYYRCGARKRKHGFNCRGTGWRVDYVDAAVWCWLCQLLDPSEFDERLAAGEDAMSMAAEPLVRRMETLRRLLTNKRADLERLVAMSAHGTQMTVELFRAEQGRIVSTIEGLERELADLDEEYGSLGLLTTEQKVELRQMVVEFAREVGDCDAVPFERRQQFVERFNVRARLVINDEDEKGVEVSCTLAGPEFILTNANPRRWNHKDKRLRVTFTEFIVI